MTGHQRIASLDLLRGLAAFAVAIPHYFVLNSIAPETAEATSVLGVEVFFVLSGFVLSSADRQLHAGQEFGRLRIFLIRRWMRTIPPYLFALVAISFLVDRLWTADFIRYALYLQNLFFQANASDYYSVAWSLAVEEWFYVLFPVSMMLVLWHASKPGNRAFILDGHRIHHTHNARASGLWPGYGLGRKGAARGAFRVDSIAYGFVLAILLAKYLPLAKGVVRYAVPALLIASAGYHSGISRYYGRRERGAAYSEQLFPFLAGTVWLRRAFVLLSDRPNHPTYRSTERFSIYLGRISYSIYLFHIIAAQLLFPMARGCRSGKFGIYLASSSHLLAVLLVFRAADPRDAAAIFRANADARRARECRRRGTRVTPSSAFRARISARLIAIASTAQHSPDRPL